MMVSTKFVAGASPSLRSYLQIAQLLLEGTEQQSPTQAEKLFFQVT